ncbi:hypothetical protein [Kineococcus sp. SYSU DK006]|uniref:hypothetical protein n=1 Tax=Kineococcus sp. SYSU DK006 TaxID=3383127 RepID=UPI003D7EA5BC
MIAAAAATRLVLAATPSPTASTATPRVDADLVTPGLWGFVSLFVLALAVYFLGRSMARRVQRVNHRARAEREAAEQGTAEQGTAPRERGGAGPAGGPGEPGRPG